MVVNEFAPEEFLEKRTAQRNDGGDGERRKAPLLIRERTFKSPPVDTRNRRRRRR